MSYLLAAAAIGAVAAATLLRHRRQRIRLHRRLARERQALIAGREPRIATVVHPRSLRAETAREGIVPVEGFLAPDALVRLQAECAANQERAERSYLLALIPGSIYESHSKSSRCDAPQPER